MVFDLAPGKLKVWQAVEFELLSNVANVAVLK